MKKSSINKYLRLHLSLKHSCRVAVALSAAVLLALAPFGSARAQCDCNETITAKTPLNDLGRDYYKLLYRGGLYPQGYNQRPIAHEQEGLSRADEIRPIGGKIVMISIGMCNTTKEFGGTLGIGIQNGFQWLAMHDNAVRGNLVVVDCAQPGKDAKKWAEDSEPWDELDERLEDAPGGVVTRDQVRVVWLKEAAIEPPDDFPGHANKLKQNIEKILDHLANPAYGFDNLKMVFLSSRTRAWTANADGTHPHSPEPQAYESGFAVKWVIEDQIQPPGGIDQGWPWLSWGPYLWADGDAPRSDGLMWPCSFVEQGNDCVHPVEDGVEKVVDQLLAFFKTDPVTRSWFLKTAVNPPTNVNVALDPPGGTYPKGQSVTFTASASPTPGRTIAEYVWTYDDGDYAKGPVVRKTFPARSQSGNPYKVHLTVIDSEGDWAFKDTTIIVNASQSLRRSSVKDMEQPSAIVPRSRQGTARRLATQSGRIAGSEALGRHR